MHPPPDPENPAWETSQLPCGRAVSLGGSGFLLGVAKPDNFIYQLFQTWRPGTMDVSFVSQDNLDNPRTMNAVYNVGARMELAKRFGKEKLAPENRDNLQLNHYVPASSPLASFFKAPDTVYTMRVLKDGSDSVGVIAALNRVYINIGLFSEEWLLHFRPLLGGKRITPIQVKIARKNSVYWQATEAPDVRYGGVPIERRKTSPAERCRRKVGSRGIPPPPWTSERPPLPIVACAATRASSPRCPRKPTPAHCSSNYLDCWNRYWRWTQTDDYRTKAREIVARPDFLDNNYLSTDFRVPLTLLQTNACSPLATNAIEGNVWANSHPRRTRACPPSEASITINRSREKREPMKCRVVDEAICAPLPW